MWTLKEVGSRRNLQTESRASSNVGTSWLIFHNRAETFVSSLGFSFLYGTLFPCNNNGMITSKRNFFLGVFLFLVPFLGLPSSWKSVLVIVCALVLISFSIRLELRKGMSTKPSRHPNNKVPPQVASSSEDPAPLKRPARKRKVSQTPSDAVGAEENPLI